MYARIHFVSPGSREKYSWVIDTSDETIDHWRHDHPEAEDLVVTVLDNVKGLEAIFWQKCLYHDVFFDLSPSSEARARGQAELDEILELASRLAKGRASELWKRCMAFRFGSDPAARRQFIIHASGQVPDNLCFLESANVSRYKEAAAPSRLQLCR